MDEALESALDNLQDMLEAEFTGARPVPESITEGLSLSLGIKLNSKLYFTRANVILTDADDLATLTTHLPGLKEVARLEIKEYASSVFVLRHLPCKTLYSMLSSHF